MKPQRWSRIAILTLFACTQFFVSLAQPTLPTFSGGTLTAFPAPFQLYPRIITNDANPDVAEVTVSGTINQGSNFVSVRLVVTRDNISGSPFVYSILKSNDYPLNFSGGVANFLITDNLIAELNDHEYILYGVEAGGVAIQLARAERVVAGDIYIIQGQSNAEANDRVTPTPGNDPNLETNRNFVRTYASATNIPGNFSNTWNVGNGNADCCFSNYNVGQWGMKMATSVATTFNIPVAIFNGAFGGASIDYFFRNESNQTDASTNYGRLLSRLQNLGINNSVRGIFWYQGETNAGQTNNVYYLSTSQYISAFNTLKSAWDNNYPSVEKIYIIQTKGCDLLSTLNEGVHIQEAQRQIASGDDLSGNRIDLISTTDIPQFSDNCHYDYTGGYKAIGERAFSVVARDFYEPLTVDERNLYTPLPAGASFSLVSSPGEPSEITITLNHPNDDMVIVGNNAQLINNFKLSTTNPTDLYTITSLNLFNAGTVGNPNWQMKLSFTKQPGTINNPTRVSYIVPNESPSPAIVNNGGNGIGLAAFENFTVTDGVLPVDPMQLSISRVGKNNRLKWTVEFNDQYEYFEVERSASRSNFKAIGTMEASGATGLGRYETDDKQPLASGNFYRIKGIKLDGKTDYSQVVVVTSNRVTKEGVIVFPNPVSTYVNATITVKEAGTAELLLHNSSGQLVSSRKIQLQEKNNAISLGELLDHRPGMYVLTVITKNERYITKIVKTQ